MINKYRIKCLTDNTHEWVLSDSTPTTCPRDGAHSIQQSATAVEQSDVQYFDDSFNDLILDDYKQLKINEIDKRTEEIILSGFTYLNNTFACSEPDTIKWSALHAHRTEVTYPYTVENINGLEFLFASATEVDAFHLEMLNHINNADSSGINLKTQVLAAVDEAGVDAIVDNR